MFFEPLVLRAHRKYPHKPCSRCILVIIIHIFVFPHKLYKPVHTHQQSCNVLTQRPNFKIIGLEYKLTLSEMSFEW